MARLFDHIRQLRDERRAFGWRGLVRKRGWRLVFVVVIGYLVRDLVLYVVIPIVVAAGLAP